MATRYASGGANLLPILDGKDLRDCLFLPDYWYEYLGVDIEVCSGSRVPSMYPRASLPVFRCVSCVPFIPSAGTRSQQLRLQKRNVIMT